MIWTHTCEFHKKFPLDYSMYCNCRIVYDGNVDAYFMNLPKAIRSVYPDEKNYGFGFTGFINNEFPFEETGRRLFNCKEVPLNE